MTEPRMPSAELQAQREYLGLTHEALSQILKVNPRTLRSWEAGRDPIPHRVREEVEAILDRTAEIVEELAAEVESNDQALLAVFRTDEDFNAEQPVLGAEGFTARWWRHVAARVAEAVPGLLIVSPDEFEAIVDEAVDAELRTLE